MKLTPLLLILLYSTCSFAQKSAKPSAVKQEPPVVKWKFKSRAPFIASSVADQNIVYAGSLDSTLYALDIQSGKLKWKFRSNGEIRSAVCIGVQHVYLSGGDGILYALEKRSGKASWMFRTLGGLLGERKYDFADYFYSTPVLYKGRLYFGAGDGHLYCVDPANGKLIWSYQTTDIVHTTPAFSDDKVFAGSFDGNVYALNCNDGSLLWKFKGVGHRYFPKGEMMGSPVVAAGLVIIGSRDYNLYALDVNQGYCHWNKQFPFGWAMALTPNDSVVYVGTSDDRLITSLDAATGRTLWSTNTQFNIFGPCTIDGTKGYVATLMGKLFCLELKTGAIQWTYTADSYKQNRSKYFKEDDSFRDDIGNVIKSPVDFIQMEYSLGAFFSSATIASGMIIITSTDGNVYALTM
jgi:outer membrane protein assembly factor BamB